MRCVFIGIAVLCAVVLNGCVSAGQYHRDTVVNHSHVAMISNFVAFDLEGKHINTVSFAGNRPVLEAHYPDGGGVYTCSSGLETWILTVNQRGVIMRVESRQRRAVTRRAPVIQPGTPDDIGIPLYDDYNPHKIRGRPSMVGPSGY